jgi:XTP/dITP diphosphohydrolase
LVKTLVFATGNKNKVMEVRKLLPAGIELLSLNEIGIVTGYEETGTTFAENSLGKALFYSQFTKYPVIADDSGLEIDFLGGAPGVYSARYIDENMPYKERCEIILKRMEAAKREERTARFKCVACCVLKGEKIECSEGKVEGEIALTLKGADGFGYDPIFYYPPLKKTFAQISIDKKNLISHRFKAFSKLFDSIKRILNE